MVGIWQWYGCDIIWMDCDCVCVPVGVLDFLFLNAHSQCLLRVYECRKNENKIAHCQCQCTCLNLFWQQSGKINTCICRMGARQTSHVVIQQQSCSLSYMHTRLQYQLPSKCAPLHNIVFFFFNIRNEREQRHMTEIHEIVVWSNRFTSN